MINSPSGNALDIQFVASKDGSKLSQAQLSAALSITFLVKILKTDLDVDAVITKTEVLGITILPDGAAEDPNLTVSLLSSDTALTAGVYFFGLKIVFALDDAVQAETSEPDGLCCFTINILQETVTG